MQVLARIVPLRDFFLEPSNYSSSRSQLVQRFGELMRKIWNPRNFKGQVSMLWAARPVAPPAMCWSAASPPHAADAQTFMQTLADGRQNTVSQVSPHEFMQAVMSASAKRFTIEKQSDPVEFFTWLLNTLHLGLTGNKRKKASIITRCLQGELQITTEAGTGALLILSMRPGVLFVTSRPI
jgi:U4/U6.U5 tri-snRNP-associated protein 2